MGEENKFFSKLLSWTKARYKENVREIKAEEELKARIDILSRGEEPVREDNSSSKIEAQRNNDYEDDFSVRSSRDFYDRFGGRDLF